jgi:signal peptidase
MKKTAEYLTLTVVVLLMAAAVFTYLGPHFGWRVDAVLSGSMEPQLKTGSLVVTRTVDPETIEVGDIITFRPTTIGENLITHRVVGIGHNSPVHFETKGDASQKPDPFTVPARNLVGKIVFHLPYLGYATEFLKTPPGFLFAVVIPGSIIIAICAINMIQALTRRSRERATRVIEDEK